MGKIIPLPENIFKNKKLVLQKLIDYGFTESAGQYTYCAKIACGQLAMTICISAEGEVGTKVVDCESNEDYVLHRTDGAVGSFVGLVKTDYENLLREVGQKCFDRDVFKSCCACAVIQYVHEIYQDELEYLWQRFPGNAVFRRKDTGKWYAALLVISKRKLGLASDELIEILNLKVPCEEIKRIVDKEKYFPGYHMNKKHWVTICLDGSVPLQEIFKRMDTSYSLARK